MWEVSWLAPSPKSAPVAWMHFEQSAILTVHNHVITRNPRISVTHDKHDKHKTWFLHITNVQEEDKGRYMCQINTVTAKTQFGYLHVVVPPNIDDSVSSSDVIVREGANVTLRCKATGSPPPSIKWKRDDNTKIAITRNNSVVLEWEGDVLTLSRVSRYDMGAYLCIATNGVPPSVSKRIKVSVDSSSPPTTIPPSTTESITTTVPSTRVYESPYGLSTMSVNHFDKGIRYQSDYNQVDRSEHKSSDTSPNRDRSVDESNEVNGATKSFIRWTTVFALMLHIFLPLNQ
uniref:Ig-like domain-containing protein n=1 Tax=Anopheles merus TaxID=30066 RepID=A0A182VK50_ANOME